MSTIAQLLDTIRRDRFFRDLPQLQRKYPPGTQFNLFEHLGYGCELTLTKWDAQRCASRWRCDVSRYREILQKVLNKYCEYFRLHQREKFLVTLIEAEIVKMVESEIGTRLREVYNQPTDRKVTALVRDYFRVLPEHQKAIIVRIA